ncbi:MAG: repressor LexA, partial [Candidatus Magasanikbacteria bacterium CG10_big_fil_rev_8_21_14_0_10_38_6]
ACGKPLEAIETPEEFIRVVREDPLRGNLYALKAKGNSMIQEGIFDGDFIIVKKQQTAENGDTVVAIIDDNEATLKKYYQEKDRIRLQPANPTFSPTYRQEVEIRGVVVKIIRNLK